MTMRTLLLLAFFILAVNGKYLSAGIKEISNSSDGFPVDKPELHKPHIVVTFLANTRQIIPLNGSEGSESSIEQRIDPLQRLMQFFLSSFVRDIAQASRIENEIETEDVKSSICKREKSMTKVLEGVANSTSKVFNDTKKGVNQAVDAVKKVFTRSINATGSDKSEKCLGFCPRCTKHPVVNKTELEVVELPKKKRHYFLSISGGTENRTTANNRVFRNRRKAIHVLNLSKLLKKRELHETRNTNSTLKYPTKQVLERTDKEQEFNTPQSSFKFSPENATHFKDLTPPGHFPQRSSEYSEYSPKYISEFSPKYTSEYYPKLAPQMTAKQLDKTTVSQPEMFEKLPKPEKLARTEQTLKQLEKTETFKNEKLNDGKLSDGKLSDGNLKDYTLKDDKLEDAKLEDAKLKDVKLKDDKFKDDKLEDVKLEDVKLEDVKLEDVKLVDVKLTDDKLKNDKVKVENLKIENHAIENLMNTNIKKVKDENVSVEAREAEKLHDKVAVVRHQIENLKNELLKNDVLKNEMLKNENLGNEHRQIENREIEKLKDENIKIDKLKLENLEKIKNLEKIEKSEKRSRSVNLPMTESVEKKLETLPKFEIENVEGSEKFKRNVILKPEIFQMFQNENGAQVENLRNLENVHELKIVQKSSEVTENPEASQNTRRAETSGILHRNRRVFNTQIVNKSTERKIQLHPKRDSGDDIEQATFSREASDKSSRTRELPVSSLNKDNEIVSVNGDFPLRPSIRDRLWNRAGELINPADIENQKADDEKANDKSTTIKNDQKGKNDEKSTSEATTKPGDKEDEDGEEGEGVDFKDPPSGKDKGDEADKTTLKPTKSIKYTDMTYLLTVTLPTFAVVLLLAIGLVYLLRTRVTKEILIT